MPPREIVALLGEGIQEYQSTPQCMGTTTQGAGVWHMFPVSPLHQAFREQGRCDMGVQFRLRPVPDATNFGPLGWIGWQKGVGLRMSFLQILQRGMRSGRHHLLPVEQLHKHGARRSRQQPLDFGVVRARRSGHILEFQTLFREREADRARGRVHGPVIERPHGIDANPGPLMC